MIRLQRVPALVMLLLLVVACTAGPNSGQVEPAAESAPRQTADVPSPTPIPLTAAEPAGDDTPAEEQDAPVEANAEPTTESAGEPVDDAAADPTQDSEMTAEDGPLSLAETERLVRADLAATTGVAVDRIETVEAVAHTWPDETLGCGSRRIVVESRPVPGYRIILAVGEQTYDYRADQQGSFKLCPDAEDVGKPLDPIR